MRVRLCIEHTNIEWEYDKDQFQAWCDGKTGFPIVDAAMRHAVIGCKVTINQVLHEVALATAPIEHQVLGKER
jgi:hypothetical protein